MRKNIDALFKPDNIAVVGASNNQQKAGYVILKNLLNIGYEKKVFPVNNREDEILGLKTYKSLSDIDEKIELVVLIAPSSRIFEIMEDLDIRMKEKNDVKVIVCAAAGYGETKTPEGIRRQEYLMEISKKYGIRVVGPNCIGVIDNINKIDTTFVETSVTDFENIRQSGISFISQSGAIAASILMWGASQPEPVKFNKFISIGNMVDVDFIDLLEYFEKDESTKVIGLYLEGYKEARKLLDTMARIAIKKPVVVLKVGKSEKGAWAANSHTGSLAGSDKIYDAAFRQYGIIRTQDIVGLMDTLQAFDQLPLPADNNLFILSQAGGPGIICTDAVSKHPIINMPIINNRSKDELEKLLPEMANICNPEGYADITAAANVKQHSESLRILLDDPNVGSIVFITVVPTFLPREELAQSLSQLYIDGEYSKKKPVFIVIMAGDYVKNCRRILEKKGIYTFENPNRAVDAASNLIKYSEFLRKHRERSITHG